MSKKKYIPTNHSFATLVQNRCILSIPLMIRFLINPLNACEAAMTGLFCLPETQKGKATCPANTNAVTQETNINKLTWLYVLYQCTPSKGKEKETK